MADPELKTLANTLKGLHQAATLIEDDAPKKAELDKIIARGKFRPAEDEAIAYWFARFLTVREDLWAVINDVTNVLEGTTSSRAQDLPYFLVGYAAVCILIRIDRIMLFEVAEHSIIQRKLNEPFPELRIPRKQFTRVFSAFVDQGSVLSLLDAMKFAKKNRQDLMALRAHPDVGFIAQQLAQLETSLNPSKRAYFRGAWAYVSHKWRRRGAVSVSNVLAGVAEGVGRTASELYQAKNKAVTDDIRLSIAGFLQPGDVIITRHAIALTNLFMPGFWPHSALYVGPRDGRDTTLCVIEARKDGVLFRPLTDTMSVDAFVVIRPNLSPDAIQQAIDRAFTHEGKPYNFDFDFFNSDRLVCTEVIYRSYDSLDGLRFPLTDRAGRKTLSAEDLLDLALDTEIFEPVAIFGVKGCDSDIVYDDKARELLVDSYRGTAGA
jgi:uncharacterized protein YycO